MDRGLSYGVFPQQIQHFLTKASKGLAAAFELTTWSTKLQHGDCVPGKRHISLRLLIPVQRGTQPSTVRIAEVMVSACLAIPFFHGLAKPISFCMFVSWEEKNHVFLQLSVTGLISWKTFTCDISGLAKIPCFFMVNIKSEFSLILFHSGIHSS